LTTSTDAEYLPMWSPNGTRIAYTRDTTTTGGPEIYLMNANGTSQTRVTNRNGTDTAVFWSPDGSKIAIRAPYGTGGSGDQIWVINTSAPFTPTRLTTAGSNYFQSWSPDGSKILFMSTRDGNAEVYAMNVDGTGQTRLTTTTSGESYAVWSADARQVAFVRSGQIWLMNGDGSNPRQMTTSAGAKSEIVWWQPKQSS
jgi:Tol biopolymer transport system component